MGIYDRDYLREESPRPAAFRERTMVTNLVIINVALYVLDVFVGRDHWLMNAMLATPDSLAKPWLWWQLISYGFAHDPNDIMHLVWNMFGLWMFGREVEAIYGRREFLRIYLASVFLGGLLWTTRMCLTVTPASWNQVGGVLGASGAVTAVILLFCIHFPRRTILFMFVLPVPAWAIGVLIIAGDLLGMGSGRNIAFDIHLVGAAFAICYYRFAWNLGRWTPSFSFPPSWLSVRPKLRVHHPEAEDDLEEQADQALAKVNREGIESLSARERRILEDYARRMREKRR